MQKINNNLKKLPSYFWMLCLLIQSSMMAQIGLGTTTPHNSALLEIKSDSKGILLPRLNTLERNNIVSPAEGLTIYNTDIKCFEFYNSMQWQNICNIKDDITVPTNVSAVAIDGGAIVSFDTDATNPAVFYAVYASDGTLLGTSTQSPIVIEGLPNGLPSSFTVVAVGNAGVSSGSAPSESVEPGPAPSAPTKLALAPGPFSASLSWQAPLSGGPVVNYVVQMQSPLNNIKEWQDVATLPASTTQYVATGLLQGIGNLYISQEYFFRVKAVNGAGENTSIVLKTVPLNNATLLMHDNFNQVPTVALWEQYGTTGVFAAAGGATSHMYGQDSGVWSLVPGNGGSTAQTIQTFSRANKTIDIQFDSYPNPLSASNSNGALHRFGFMDVNTNATLQFYYTGFSTANNNINTELNGVISKSATFRQVENQIIHVRIVVQQDGMVKVFSNGGLRVFWMPSDITGMFTNIKFFAYSTNTGQPQYIDNFTVSEY